MSTWARSDGGSNLVTSYEYTNTGELVLIAYSDDTPVVSFTYDRLGRQVRMVRTWGDCFGYYLVATGKADLMLDPGGLPEILPDDPEALLGALRALTRTNTIPPAD